LRPHPVLANHHLLSHHRPCRNRIGFATVPCYIDRYPRSVNASECNYKDNSAIQTNTHVWFRRSSLPWFTSSATAISEVLTIQSKWVTFTTRRNNRIMQSQGCVLS
jgi:hypothetical protein